MIITHYRGGGRHFWGYDMDIDLTLRGAAEIYERAHAWGHLPPLMEFATFLAAIDRGDNPFTNDDEAAGQVVHETSNQN